MLHLAIAIAIGIIAAHYGILSIEHLRETRRLKRSLALLRPQAPTPAPATPDQTGLFRMVASSLLFLVLGFLVFCLIANA